MPPDNRGRIADADVASLKEFRRIINKTFAVNLAKSGTITASNTRGNDAAFAPGKILDGDRKTYWSTDDDVHTPEFTVAFPKPVSFNVVELREALPLGQRVEAFVVETMQNGKWVDYSKGSAIGNRCLLRGKPVTAEQVRVRITGCPSARQLRNSACMRRRNSGAVGRLLRHRAESSNTFRQILGLVM